MPATPLHHRRSIRLDGYDYTQSGGYFVTLVTAGRIARFGAVHDGEMRLNAVGEMVWREWQRLPGRFPGLVVDAFVVMPDHVHGVFFLVGAQRCDPGPSPETASLRPYDDDGDSDSVGAQRCDPGPSPETASLRPYQGESLPPYETASLRPYYDPHVVPGSVGAIVRAWKSSTTLRFHRMRDGSADPLWQRNYYEHIIRGPAELDRIRAYILANPARP